MQPGKISSNKVGEPTQTQSKVALILGKIGDGLAAPFKFAGRNVLVALKGSTSSKVDTLGKNLMNPNASGSNAKISGFRRLGHGLLGVISTVPLFNYIPYFIAKANQKNEPAVRLVVPEEPLISSDDALLLFEELKEGKLKEGQRKKLEAFCSTPMEALDVELVSYTPPSYEGITREKLHSVDLTSSPAPKIEPPPKAHLTSVMRIDFVIKNGESPAASQVYEFCDKCKTPKDKSGSVTVNYRMKSGGDNLFIKFNASTTREIPNKMERDLRKPCYVYPMDLTQPLNEQFEWFNKYSEDAKEQFDSHTQAVISIRGLTNISPNSFLEKISELKEIMKNYPGVTFCCTGSNGFGLETLSKQICNQAVKSFAEGEILREKTNQARLQHEAAAAERQRRLAELNK